MIKFSSTGHDDSVLLGLGISELNVRKLKEGMPIYIKDEELEKLTGWNGNILLLYGRTEEDITKDIEGIFNAVSADSEVFSNSEDDHTAAHETYSMKQIENAFLKLNCKAEEKKKLWKAFSQFLVTEGE